MAHPSDPSSNPNTPADELIRELIGDAAGELSCALCGCPHEADGVKVVQQVGERYTLSVQCFCCGTGSLMTVRAPLGTQHPLHERESFAHLPPITPSDVLAWHDFLQDYQGDLRALWRTKT
jgi:hypothetical protein